MRLARAFTGRDKIVKIQGHFHGWHDYAAVAMQPPYDVPISKGVPLTWPAPSSRRRRATPRPSSA